MADQDKAAQRPILVFSPLEGPMVIIRPPALSPWQLDLQNDFVQKALVYPNRTRNYVTFGCTVAYRSATEPTTYGEGCRWDMHPPEWRQSGRRVLRFTELPEGPMSVEEIVRRLT